MCIALHLHVSRERGGRDGGREGGNVGRGGGGGGGAEIRHDSLRDDIIFEEIVGVGETRPRRGTRWTPNNNMPASLR